MSAADIFDLHGKVALVTGASSGLGARFAEVLSQNGAAVVLVARRAERLAALQARIVKSGGKAITVAADVRDRNAMAGAFDAAEKAFGTVTILVNNAGVAHAARAVELGEDEWRRILGTDLDAVFFCAQEAARRMLAVNLQTSYMHPPLGPTLFYLRSVAPPEVTTRDIYIGIIPFVLIQLAMLIALWFVPGLATSLPHRLYAP